ncbi:Zinc-type alcohol dehydrogenase-like protein [Escovopsis weberi]|uniref:Zinc-type alcohol dehydrogenase-like protein n=1 Tax=Escovopsis weberi TaxID=150374 RepID=A0A0M8NA61_ESCWE|nr:Zinc-type alcohol dehydrogenase-like protein [Escovopsis weberi]
MASHMRAWRTEASGRIEDTLKLVDDAPRPNDLLTAGQILIRVASASLNPADYKIRAAGMFTKLMLKFPNTPGMDLSGRVVAVGEGVTDVKAGDAVMARVEPLKGDDGSLSEYVVVGHDAYALVPADVDLDAAAAVPTAGLTAYQTIAPYVKAGDKVFINGGSGGVGTFGIQVAKALGCHVTVSCSTAKKALCEELGADETIDYKVSDLMAELKKKGPVFSLAVDNVGLSPGDFYEKSATFLLPSANFIHIGGSPTLASTSKTLKSIFLPSFLGGGKNKFVYYLTKNKHDDLAQIAQWMAEGKVKAIIDSTYEFEDTPKAFEHLKKGTSTGKVIVHVSKV